MGYFMMHIFTSGSRPELNDIGCEWGRPCSLILSNAQQKYQPHLPSPALLFLIFLLQGRQKNTKVDFANASRCQLGSSLMWYLIYAQSTSSVKIHDGPYGLI